MNNSSFENETKKSSNLDKSQKNKKKRKFKKIGNENKNILQKKRKKIFEKKPSKKLKNKKENKIPSITFYKILENESLSFYDIDNTFIVFESYDNLIYLVYSNENLSIVLYNLVDEKKIIIKNIIFKFNDHRNLKILIFILELFLINPNIIYKIYIFNLIKFKRMILFI